jgi:hypothetical protein
MTDFITKLTRGAGREKEPKDGQSGAAKAREGEVVRHDLDAKFGAAQ